MFLNSVSNQVAEDGKAAGRGKSVVLIETGVKLKETVEAFEMIHINAL